MFFDIVFNPAVAVLLFVGLIYFWLLSPIHFKAMLDARLYRVMNWSMVIDGLLFWWLVLDPRPAPPARLAPGRRILVVIAAIPPQIILGAFIFSRRTSCIRSIRSAAARSPGSRRCAISRSAVFCCGFPAP